MYPLASGGCNLHFFFSAGQVDLTIRQWTGPAVVVGLSFLKRGEAFPTGHSASRHRSAVLAKLSGRKAGR